MKIKLLLLAGVGFVPSVLMGQAFLYNKGVMSVKSTGVTNTTLYVGGDFVAGSDATVACDITLDNSKTVLIGDFIHDLNRSGVPAGKWANVFRLGTNESKFEFRGTAAQSIKLGTGLVYGTGYLQKLKGENYINFPRIVVNNNKHVTLVPELAAQAAKLDLDRGRLILDSRRSVATDFSGVGNAGGVYAQADASSMLAHFMVAEPAVGGNNISNKNASYVGGAATTNNDFGAVQVNLELDEKKPKDPDKTGRSLVGMGSPFKSLLSDYFFWNFLMIPKGESVLGGQDAGLLGLQNGHTMTDPQKTLKAGEGFVIGIDLRDPKNDKGENNYTFDLHTMYQSITPVAQKPNFDTRVEEKYQFSRFNDFFFGNTNNVRRVKVDGTVDPTLHDNVKSTMTVVDNNNEAYTGEVLNHASITGLPITPGYNYYSNPYTVPLDLSEIVNATAAGGKTLTDWGNIVVGPSGLTGRHFTNKVWILDPSSKGSGTYDIFEPGGGSLPLQGPGNKWILVNAPYRIMKDNGSTLTNYYDTGDLSQNTVAPLQMFVLWSPDDAPAGSLTIPAKARKITSNASFLRSTTATANNRLRDDFLFSIVDSKTGGVDRAAIVIRTPQEVMTEDRYEPTKKLSTIITIDPNASTTRSTTEEEAVNQTYRSLVYTKGDSGAYLESNVLGVPSSAESESVVLYLTPSFTDQEITVSVTRFETAERVKAIWLKDKIANKEVNLSANPTYKSTSKSTDPTDRFTLRFVFDTSGVEDGDYSEDLKTITSFYQNGTLTVTGFDDVDYGSTIFVYDIQGRMLAQSKVNDTQVEITQPFSSGAYIVKVVGNKSYAAKFLVK